MSNNKSHPLPFGLQMRLLEASNHHKSQCNFCFHWQQSQLLQHLGFLPLQEHVHNEILTGVIPPFPCCRLFFNKLRRQSTRLWDRSLLWEPYSRLTSSYPWRSCGCALLGDIALPKSRRSSLAEVSTFHLPRCMSRSGLKAGWAAQPQWLHHLHPSRAQHSMLPVAVTADKHLSPLPSQGNSDYLDLPNPKQLLPSGRAAGFPSIY